MPAKTNLRRIQSWLQEFIVDPESDQAVYGKNNDEATRLILPSRTLAPVQRVAIYRDMYLLRMEEALAGDFPVLKHHLGGQGFKDLVADYVQHYPSKSYTLNRLRKNLPDFIVEKAAVRRRAFAFDLARLELAMCEAFDAPRSSVLTPHAIAEVPETAWENARIRTIEALSLLAFRYPADEYLQSVKDESAHPSILRKDGWLAVYRRDYSIWRLRLTRPGYQMLDSLRRGATLGEAIGVAHHQQRVGKSQLFHWFHRWVSEGIISAVEWSEPSR